MLYRNECLITFSPVFSSGMIADRVNLRYYLVIGMLGESVLALLYIALYYTLKQSGFVKLLLSILGGVLNLFLLGIAYYAEIHHIAYFIIVQIIGGVTQVGGVK